MNILSDWAFLLAKREGNCYTPTYHFMLNAFCKERSLHWRSAPFIENKSDSTAKEWYKKVLALCHLCHESPRRLFPVRFECCGWVRQSQDRKSQCPSRPSFLKFFWDGGLPNSESGWQSLKNFPILVGLMLKILISKQRKQMLHSAVHVRILVQAVFGRYKTRFNPYQKVGLAYIRWYTFSIEHNVQDENKGEIM